MPDKRGAGTAGSVTTHRVPVGSAIGLLAVIGIALWGPEAISTLQLPGTGRAPLSAALLLCMTSIGVAAMGALKDGVLSPPVIAGGVYCVSLGAPSLLWGMGFGREDFLFKARYVTAVDYYATGVLVCFCLAYWVPEWVKRCAWKGQELTERAAVYRSAGEPDAMVIVQAPPRKPSLFSWMAPPAR